MHRLYAYNDMHHLEALQISTPGVGEGDVLLVFLGDPIFQACSPLFQEFVCVIWPYYYYIQ